MDPARRMLLRVVSGRRRPLRGTADFSGAADGHQGRGEIRLHLRQGGIRQRGTCWDVCKQGQKPRLLPSLLTLAVIASAKRKQSIFFFFFHERHGLPRGALSLGRAFRATPLASRNDGGGLRVHA